MGTTPTSGPATPKDTVSPTSQNEAEPMEWQFQSRQAGAALSAKRAFLTFLRESCTAESDCDGALIVFGELVTNVVLHAPGPIEVTVSSDPYGVVTLDVCDAGDGFVLEPSLPPPWCGGGRGLYIVSQLCRRASVTRVGHGTKVSVELPVRPKLSVCAVPYIESRATGSDSNAR